MHDSLPSRVHVDRADRADAPTDGFGELLWRHPRRHRVLGLVRCGAPCPTRHDWLRIGGFTAAGPFHEAGCVEDLAF